MEQTIQQVCEILGIARPTLYQRMNKLSIRAIKRGKQAYLKEEQIQLLHSNFLDSRQTHQTDSRQIVDTSEILFLREQLQAANTRETDLRRLLDQEQQLSLMKERRVEELTFKLKLLQAPRETIQIPQATIEQWEKTRDILLKLQQTIQEQRL